MKQLILIRHAKSSWKRPELPDRERPLNKRGNRDAPEMGRRLARKKVRPDLVITSPARRARATARKITRELEYAAEASIDERLFGATAEELLDVVRCIDEGAQHAMLFGHNPEITEFAEELTRERLDNVPTCGVVRIELDIARWNEVEMGSGRLVEFDYPKRNSEERNV